MAGSGLIRSLRVPGAAGAAWLLVASSVLVLAPALPARADFVTPLAVPDEIVVDDGDVVNLVADEAAIPIMPGAATNMWVYNGTFPGPTIRHVTNSDSPTPVTVNLTNQLAASAGDITLHNHGNHSLPAFDGRPDGAEVVGTGETYGYDFDAWESGAPERATTQWYHDHIHGETGRNVYMGMAGFYIIENPSEAALGLPSGDFDIPLMLMDRNIDEANNQFFYDTEEIDAQQVFLDDPSTTSVVTRYLVNGVHEPYLDVEPNPYRFRILNAANSEVFTLELRNRSCTSAGTSQLQPFAQIGTDAGLMEAPVTRTVAELGPAERLDVVVDFGALTGSTFCLEVPAVPGPRVRFLEFRVALPDSNPPGQVPSTLRTDLPDLTSDPVTAVRTVVLDREAGGPLWEVNGEQYTPGAPPMFRPAVGTTEMWRITNQSEDASHVLHLHDSDQQAIRRLDADGDEIPIEDWERHKEAWRVEPGETLELLFRYPDTGTPADPTTPSHVGPYMFHCHLLEHEDNHMMGEFEVVDPGVTGTADVPVVSNPGPRSSQVGTAITPLTITATDPDGDPVTFSASGLPPGLSINPATGVISGTPTDDGTFTVVVLASDGFATAGASSFTWTVTPVGGTTTTTTSSTTTTVPSSTTTTVPGTTTTTTPGTPGEGDRFVDDDGSTFESDIEELAEWGVTRGCNPPDNDRFCPEDTVTRGQMATFLVRALGLAAGAGDPFSDDDGSVFEADVEALAAAGITSGCGPGSFCPEDPVTRGQMAAFLVRSLDLIAPAGDGFVDDDTSVFEADIEALAAAGITRGCNPPVNDRFCPDDPVTRGQMAAFLVRARPLIERRTASLVAVSLAPTAATLVASMPEPVALITQRRATSGLICQL